MRTLNYFSIVLVAIATILNSCKKDTKKADVPATPVNTSTTTYNFTQANFTASTQRISMLEEMTSYMASTNTSTTLTQPTLQAQKLKDMYTNLNQAFSSVVLNSSGVNLEEKASNTFSINAVLENDFNESQSASIFAAATPTSSSASYGVKGKLISSSQAILIDSYGYEYKEALEKVVMGAVFYYQATSILINIKSYNNITVLNGGTDQQKAWDAAFGYFGVPVDFPSNTNGLKYWGNYANSVNTAIDCNVAIMNAFLRGRMAINNNDMRVIDSAATVILNMWEKVAAAKCISYLKNAKINMSDMANVLHNMSAAHGLVYNLKYNSAKVISDGDIVFLNNEMGLSFYDITQTRIDNTISKLAGIFNLDVSKL